MKKRILFSKDEVIGFKDLDFVDIESLDDEECLAGKVIERIQLCLPEWENLEQIQKELRWLIEKEEKKKESILSIHYPAIIFYSGLLLGVAFGIKANLTSKETIINFVVTIVACSLFVTWLLITRTKKYVDKHEKQAKYCNVIKETVDKVILDRHERCIVKELNGKKQTNIEKEGPVSVNKLLDRVRCFIKR